MTYCLLCSNSGSAITGRILPPTPLRKEDTKGFIYCYAFCTMTTRKKTLSEESKSLQPSNIFQSPVPNIQFSKNILRRSVCCFVFTCDYRIFSVICFGVKYSIPWFRNILEVFLRVSIWRSSWREMQDWLYSLLLLFQHLSSSLLEWLSRLYLLLYQESYHQFCRPHR